MTPEELERKKQNDNYNRKLTIKNSWLSKIFHEKNLDRHDKKKILLLFKKKHT